MDLPPLQFEMLRFGLQGQPAEQLCRPASGRIPTGADGQAEEALAASFSGSSPCWREMSRIRIDEPAGWPVLPPPPLPPPPQLKQQP